MQLDTVKLSWECSLLVPLENAIRTNIKFVEVLKFILSPVLHKKLNLDKLSLYTCHASGFCL